MTGTKLLWVVNLWENVHFTPLWGKGYIQLIKIICWGLSFSARFQLYYYWNRNWTMDGCIFLTTEVTSEQRDFQTDQIEAFFPVIQVWIQFPSTPQNNTILRGNLMQLLYDTFLAITTNQEDYPNILFVNLTLHWK